MKKIITLMLTVATVVLTACSDDEKKATLKQQFVFEGTTTSLESANLYLLHEQNSDQHTYREYFITDGTYLNGEGYSLGNYEDATYVLVLTLGFPQGADLQTGSFPMFYDHDAVPGESTFSQISYVGGSGATYAGYDTPEDAENDAAVVVKGGFEDGETLAATFSGTLTYTYIKDESWAHEDVTGKFAFTGEVEDLRAMPARMAKP